MPSRAAYLSAAVFLVLGFALSAFAQSSGNNIWNQIKNAGKQPQQQQQPQQPQQRSKPAQQPAAQAADPNGPFTPPPGTKIDPLVLAPAQTAYSFSVSPHGEHVATMAMSGSRQVIIYDGVTGPKFDQLIGQGGGQPTVYSPDGEHWAYCARTGTEWFVMVDGKELTHSSASVNGGIGTTQCMLGFSSNSKHVWYTSSESTSPITGATRFVWDGQASPLGADSDTRNYAFSPDGDHFAYLLNDVTPHSQRPPQLIIDGKPAPYEAGEPQWTADSQHLFTKRYVRAANTREVLYDGKPILRADNVTIYIPPVGNMVIFKIIKNTQFLVIGGKVVPNSETTGQIGPITFSPDGKHFAAEYTMPNNRNWIMADGKKGQEYIAIKTRSVGTQSLAAQFTADSSTLVYEAGGGSGNPYIEFLNINGQESESILPAGFLELSPVGRHVVTAGSGQLTLDGKIINLPGINIRTTQISQLSWSPDGSHYAFVLGHVYVDGVPQNDYSPVNNAASTGSAPRFYTWSPDGKHIAYFCRSSSPSASDDTYLCLDDKAVKLGGPPVVNNLIFSSDGNHLFWARGMGQNKIRVFADGKPVVEGILPMVGGLSKQTWETGPDGTLSVILQDQSNTQRYTITPSPQTSIATLFGGGTTVAGK
jgi:hypothetical protein